MDGRLSSDNTLPNKVMVDGEETEIIFEYFYSPATAEDIEADRPDAYRVVRNAQARNGVIIYALHNGEWQANPWNIRSLVKLLLEQRSQNSEDPILDIYELERQHIEWIKETFAHEPPLSAIKHLQREVEELYNDPTNLIEYADCLLLLLSAASRAGYSFQDILRAGWEKLAINKGREWDSPDADGIIEHKRDTHIAVPATSAVCLNPCCKVKRIQTVHDPRDGAIVAYYAVGHYGSNEFLHALRAYDKNIKVTTEDIKQSNWRKVPRKNGYGLWSESQFIQSKPGRGAIPVTYVDVKEWER